MRAIAAIAALLLALMTVAACGGGHRGGTPRATQTVTASASPSVAGPQWCQDTKALAAEILGAKSLTAPELKQWGRDEQTVFDETRAAGVTKATVRTEARLNIVGIEILTAGVGGVDQSELPKLRGAARKLAASC